MGSQIESWLKRAKSQKLQYILHENLNFEGPGPPKTNQKRVQNWFPSSSSTRKPSKSLLRASWSPLGSSWSRKNVVGVALGRSWGALGAEKKILGAALGRSKRNLKTGFNYLGGQSAPKREPGSIQNGVPNRVRVEKGEITENAIPLTRKPQF